MLIYGKEIAQQMKKKLTEQNKNTKMALAIVRIGDDPSSRSYVRGISKYAEEVQVQARVLTLETNATEHEVLEVIRDLNQNPTITGIMLQTPFPPHLNASVLVNAIDYSKDVEGIHNYNLGKLISKEAGVKPCTPKAVLSMLKAHQVALEGKKVTIIGRSMTVGIPLSLMMTAENATVTLCHSRTKNLKAEVLAADIVVAALGQKEFVTADMVHKDMVVIDVGINVDENGRMLGDVHQKAQEKAAMVSAVPGGIGMITVAELFDNLSTLAGSC